MQRVNHRRVSAAMQYAVRRYLEQTPMGRGTFVWDEQRRELRQRCKGATPGQIKAAAKQIIKSGKMPAAMPQMIRRSALA